MVMATVTQVRKVARDCSLIFNALGDPNRQDILIMGRFLWLQLFRFSRMYGFTGSHSSDSSDETYQIERRKLFNSRGIIVLINYSKFFRRDAATLDDLRCFTRLCSPCNPRGQHSVYRAQ